MEYNYLLTHKKLLLLTLLLITIHLKIILSQINDNFESGILESENESDFIDIADYHNLSLIISTSKNIYLATPLSKKTTTNANLNLSSFAATCNDNYVLVSCLEDSLLSKINLETGEATSLIPYENENFGSIYVSKHSCSLSILDNYVFIVVSQPGSSNDMVSLFFIRLNISNKNDETDGPIIGENVVMKSFIFPYEIQKSNSSRDISCETVFAREVDEFRLLCIHEKKTDKNYIYAFIINSDFNGLENDEKEIKKSVQEFGFRLYYLDKYYIRCVTRQFIYDIYLDKEFIIKKYTGNSNLTSYESFYNLFLYHNNFVFSLRKENNFMYTTEENKTLTYFKINTIIKDHYIIFCYEDSYIDMKKIIGFYNETKDYLLLIYQMTDKTKYFSFPNNKDIFNITSIPYIYRAKSNEQIDYDYSNIIEASKDFGTLTFYDFTTIYSSTEYTYINNPINSTSLSALPINIISNKLNIEASTNYWYEINFAFSESNDEYIRIFNMPNAKISIRTCTFQCGSCSNDYYKCDGCRDSLFAKLNGADDDNCYPINQTIKGYIYSSTTQQFEKCYQSCQFCTSNEEESSDSSHNCIICNDGYSPSYVYIGNCYKIDEYEKDKVISSITDESFTLTSCDSLPKEYKIASTGECISLCPQTSSYSYISNVTYINYTEMEFGLISSILAYEISSEIPQKYSLGNL